MTGIGSWSLGWHTIAHMRRSLTGNLRCPNLFPFSSFQIENRPKCDRFKSLAVSGLNRAFVEVKRILHKLHSDETNLTLFDFACLFEIIFKAELNIEAVWKLHKR
jgi:hypothetical protein